MVPVGARATATGDSLHLVAFVGHPSGRPSIRLSAAGNVGAAEELGRALAAAMLGQGARQILDEVRSTERFP
jgi:hydroxymethylbilane synthase